MRPVDVNGSVREIQRWKENHGCARSNNCNEMQQPTVMATAPRRTRHCAAGCSSTYFFCWRLPVPRRRYDDKNAIVVVVVYVFVPGVRRRRLLVRDCTWIRNIAFVKRAYSMRDKRNLLSIELRTERVKCIELQRDDVIEILYAIVSVRHRAAAVSLHVQWMKTKQDILVGWQSQAREPFITICEFDNNVTA